MSPSGRAPVYPRIEVHVPSDHAERVAAELWDLCASGIEQRDGTTIEGPGSHDDVTLVAYFATKAAAADGATRLQGRYRARAQELVGDEWRDGWRKYFKPTRIGARLLLRPSWESVRAWPEEVVLTIDPGRAFGSGLHETTRIVLREIDRRVRGGERVLDVGCGSGILSVAALLLGAARARAVDVDPEAVPVVRENAKLNGVAARVRADTTHVARLRGHYDLIVANIQAGALAEMAQALQERLAPAGTLVLSGMLRGQHKQVRRAFPDLALRLVPAENEWVGLVLEHANRAPP